MAPCHRVGQSRTHGSAKAQRSEAHFRELWVTVGGGVAMGLTALIGQLVGVTAL